MREQPAFALGLTRELGKQLQESRPLVEPSRGSDTLIAVVPIGADVRIDAVAEPLFEAIQTWEPAARVDRPPAGEDPSETLVRLEHLERQNDRVLFVSSPVTGRTPDAWAEFCMRQADRIVAVVGREPPADWVRYHPALLDCDLVLMGDSGEAARAWVKEVRPHRTHRIRTDSVKSDTRRMARRLTGRAVGVVLSGGGARAFAHVGVLDELEKAGVVIDRIGATSMGAFIAGMYAQEMDPEEIDARCYEEFIRRSPLGDIRLPRVSLSSGERARRMLMRNLPGYIEDLPRDFYCVSAELISGQQVTHRFGHLAYAVSASMCLPGLVPAVPDAGRYLIDGGAINNLPVAEMAQGNEGPVIAIDVTAQAQDAASGMKGFQTDEWPWDDNAPQPTIAETITRLVLLGSVDTREAAYRHADLVVFPEDDGVGLLEFHMLDTMRESGRRAARRALVDAPSSLFVS
jgi:predicted acylesterase/phospholipase RssA